MLALPADTRLAVAFPLRVSAAITHALAVENLQAQGFVRVSAEGVIRPLDELSDAGIDLAAATDPLVVVDGLRSDRRRQGGSRTRSGLRSPKAMASARCCFADAVRRSTAGL